MQPSQNLTIPRGKVYFKKFTFGNGEPERWVDLGNCPETVFSPKYTSVKTYDSINGVIVPDEIFTTGAELSCRIVTDDLSLTNLTLWGNNKENNTPVKSKRVVISVQQPIDEFIIFDDIPNTRILVTDQLNRSWINNIHYSYDESLNGIRILSNDYINTTTSLTVSFFTMAMLVPSYAQANLDPLEGELRFVSYNPHGPRWHYRFFRVVLSAAQDHVLTADPNNIAWSQLSINADVFMKPGMHELYSVRKTNTAVLTLRGKVLVNDEQQGFYISV